MTEIKHRTVTFCGDFCLSGSDIEKYLTAFPIIPWGNLAIELENNKSAIVANLECSITAADKGRPFKWANLKLSPDLHYLLNGLSMAVLGNNHIGDFGEEGVRDTLSLLNQKSIPFVGVGTTLDDALKPAFIELASGRLGIISLCCPTTNSEFIATHQTQGVAPLGMATLKQAIMNASPQCDAIVAYLHWGCEWVHDPAPDQLRLARHAIDCGADAVIGCHSHTIQSYEQYKGRWIFYSLGNYLFNAGDGNLIEPDGTMKRIPINLKPENRESLAVTFHISKGKETQNRLCLDHIQPMYFGEDWIPRPVNENELSFDLQAANNRLKKYSRRHSNYLQSREEPVFKSLLRNGIMAYWYSTESIQSSPFYIFLFSKINILTTKLIRLAKKCVKFSFSHLHSLLLNLRIEAKWRLDCRKLPLTPAHRELYNIIHRLYWRELRDFPNLVNCRDFNDRIQWLKLFDQDEKIVLCSDKIRVRDYICKKVGDKYLVKLYQVRDHFHEIDFETLPKAFVIKTNHDSGTVILVKDKTKLNYFGAKKKIESALLRPFGWYNGEWAYSFIIPKVFVEEFIEPNKLAPPADYKFYIIEGKMKFCHYISNRGFQTMEQTIDITGEDLKTELYPSFKLSSTFEKPALWNEMIRVAEKVATGFKCVRVDLFFESGRIYVGEMTFWPMAGCYKGNGQKKIGRLLDFDRSTIKPFLIPKLRKNYDHFNCKI